MRPDLYSSKFVWIFKIFLSVLFVRFHKIEEEYRFYEQYLCIKIKFISGHLVHKKIDFSKRMRHK